METTPLIGSISRRPKKAIFCVVVCVTFGLLIGTYSTYWFIHKMQFGSQQIPLLHLVSQQGNEWHIRYDHLLGAGAQGKVYVACKCANGNSNNNNNNNHHHHDSDNHYHGHDRCGDCRYAAKISNFPEETDTEKHRIAHLAGQFGIGPRIHATFWIHHHQSDDDAVEQYGETPDLVPVVIMDYINGTILNVLPSAMSLREMCLSVMSLVDVLHALNVVHGDIHISNFMFGVNLGDSVCDTDDNMSGSNLCTLPDRKLWIIDYDLSQWLDRSNAEEFRYALDDENSRAWSMLCYVSDCRDAVIKQ